MTRANNKNILIVDNTLSGKIVDATGRSNGDTLIWDEASDKYIHAEVPPSAGAELEANKVSVFQVTPDDTHYPSEKLTYDSISVKRDKTEIGDAHGFIAPPNSGNFTMSNVGSSVTVNLLAIAGNYKINGTLYVNAGLSLTFTATLGQNYIVITPSGLLKDSTISITDLTKIPCCTINYDGTSVVLAEELHLASRNLIQHQKEHDTDGARWVSGFLTTFGAGAANTFSTANGVLRDEERYHTIATKTNCAISYRNAAQTAMITDTPSTTFAKINGGIARWDNAGVLTDLTNNSYGVYWLYATNRKLPANAELVSVMGQGEYGSIALAQAAPQPTLAGMTVAEWKLLYRIIVRRTAVAPFSFIQADDLRLQTTGLAVSGSGLSNYLSIDSDEIEFALINSYLNY